MSGLLQATPTEIPAEARPSTISKPNLLLLVFGYGPFLLLFFINLWGRPHYQFFPLVLAGAAFLGWVRTSEVERPIRPGAWQLAAFLWTLSFALLALGTIFWSPWLGSLAAFTGAVALLWMAGGWPILRAGVPALILVGTIIPPPLSLDTRFAEYLRAVAVNWSSHLLDLLSVTHARSGNVIELPGAKLLVEEACSGINSVLIAIACCLFYLMWQRRSTPKIILAVLTTVSFVLLGNVVRITFGAWLKFRYNIEMLSGWKHEMVGIILFASYMVLIVSVDYWFTFLTSPWRRRKTSASAMIPGELPLKADGDPEMAGVATPRRFPSFAIQGLACCFALLGSVDLALAWTHRHDHSQYSIASSGLKTGAKFTLPDRIGPWVRLSSEAPLLHRVETLGVNSQVWHYQNGDLLASVALDYPFTGYHDVTTCYTLAGWKVNQQQSHWGAETDTGIASARVLMQEDTGMNGNLWFSTVDQQGHWLESPVLQRALTRRWQLPGKIEPTTYRVQALAATYTPLRPEEEKDVQSLFRQARALLWRDLSAQLGK